VTDEDEFPFWEDVAKALRKITWANIKTTLETWLNTLYVSVSGEAWTDLTDGGETDLHTHAGGGGGTPGGSDGEMQYNNAGAFGGLSGFYWDPTNGIVYLGRTGTVDAGAVNTDVCFTLLAKADDKQSLWTMHSWGAASTTSPTLAAYRSRGTRAAPSAIMSGDRMLNIAGFAHDGVGWVGSVARILFKATENFSSTAHGAGIFFEGVPRGSTTRAEFAGLDEDGMNLPTGAEYLVNGALHTHPTATSSEVTTGTDTAKAITPDALRGSDYGKRVGTISVIDAATTITTGDGKKSIFIPAEFDGWKIVALHATLVTASTSGAPIIQVRNVTDGVDVLSTRITIDQSEKTSYTAATAPVIDTSNNTVATGDEIAIDLDGAGTGAKGLDVIISLQKAGA